MTKETIWNHPAMPLLILILVFVVGFTSGLAHSSANNNRQAIYCAYSNGYLDAELKYLQTTNLTEMEKATKIFGNSTREAFIGFMACNEVGWGTAEVMR